VCVCVSVSQSLSLSVYYHSRGCIVCFYTEQFCYSILLILDLWIFIKLLCSKVIVSFAYQDSLCCYYSDYLLAFLIAEALMLFEWLMVGSFA